MTDYTFTLLAKPNTGDYYEGNRSFLRAIYPRPTVSPMRLLSDSLLIKEIVFREDSYDPTTRLRRGRFYQKTDPIEIPSGLVPHQPYPRPHEITGASSGRVFVFQTTFEQSTKLNASLQELANCDVLIGAAPAETRWRIIDAEGLSDGTTLFTLKSLSSFGLLPKLEKDNIEIKAAYENVVDASLKYAPTPIVDVCRSAANEVLLAWLPTVGVEIKEKQYELAQLADMVPKGKDKERIAPVAKLLARLHSHSKPSVQKSQVAKGVPLRPVIDDDAELAIRLFGFLLRDIGWAL